MENTRVFTVGELWDSISNNTPLTNLTTIEINAVNALEMIEQTARFLGTVC